MVVGTEEWLQRRHWRRFSSRYRCNLDKSWCRLPPFINKPSVLLFWLRSSPFRISLFWCCFISFYLLSIDFSHHLRFFCVCSSHVCVCVCGCSSYVWFVCANHEKAPAGQLFSFQRGDWSVAVPSVLLTYVPSSSSSSSSSMLSLLIFRTAQLRDPF